jgi:hypothetical protein
MKTDFNVYEPAGGVTVFQEPPVKCRIIGQSDVAHEAVGFLPPPTVQTSAVLIMKTEFRLFIVPIAMPLVHMNPFQW